MPGPASLLARIEVGGGYLLDAFIDADVNDDSAARSIRWTGEGYN